MSSQTKYRGVRIRGGSIQVDFRYKGKRCRETLSIHPTDKNLQIASDRLGQIRLAIMLNQFNYADYFPESKSIDIFGGQPVSYLTVSEYIDIWWKNGKPKDESSYKKEKGMIKNHIKPMIGRILIQEIKSGQVTEFIESLPLQNSTKNNVITTLRKIFQKAASEDYCTKNIMDNISHLKREKPNKNPLNINEVNKLLNYLVSKEEKHYYQFAIWTGLSTGEQLGLTWGDIDFTKYIIHINRLLTLNKVKNTKNTYRERSIEILNPSYESLMELMPVDYWDNPDIYKNRYIFKNPKTGEAWASDVIGEVWGDALKVLSIPHRSPYETRHTFASIMVTACVPDGWIRAQMGHATMKMLSTVYAKWLGDADVAVEWILEHTKSAHNGAQFKKLFIDIYSSNEPNT